MDSNENQFEKINDNIDLTHGCSALFEFYNIEYIWCLVDFVIHRDESVWIDFKGHI
jgi:hypothetical protein